MGVVTISSSAARTPFGLSTRFSTHPSGPKRTVILAFKPDKTKNTAFVAPQESISLPVDASKNIQNNPQRIAKSSQTRVRAVSTDEASLCTLELDYNEAAAKLETIYKLSPTSFVSDTEDKDPPAKRERRRRTRFTKGDEEAEKGNSINIVRIRRKKAKRLSLDQRIALKMNKEDVSSSNQKRNHSHYEEDERINKLVREYSVSTDMVGLNWNKMKIPQVLPSSEQAWLFKLMQPTKTIIQVRDNLQNDLGRETTDCELAQAMNMNVVQLRKRMEVGRDARNKLIKHNLRLVLFVMNKYFKEFANGPKFQDLCQAGVKGLITAIDRFEPKRRFRLSTYGLFWIRHAIIRSMTVSSFMRVSFGLESVRMEIQKAKLELFFELKRIPTEEEILENVGISTERYYEVMRASKPVLSLHGRHVITNEEFINAVLDIDGIGGDKHRQSALVRLALDDVLDSLKPKESLVIRQRYGLDGKGDRTLGEIAGNLNISREMVRKHELKALMKLKHPARMDYLCQYVF